MEPKKDKWVNDVLGSIDNVQQAEPGPFLYAKIQNRLAAEGSVVYVPARTVWFTVASFGLLLLLNWRIISHQPTPVDADSAELNTVISGMQLYPSTNQPYDLWNGQSY